MLNMMVFLKHDLTSAILHDHTIQGIQAKLANKFGCPQTRKENELP